MSTVGTSEIFQASAAPNFCHDSNYADAEALALSNAPSALAISPPQTARSADSQLLDNDMDSVTVDATIRPQQSSTKVLYRVEYTNKDGQVVLSREDEGPEKIKPKVNQSTVLEVVTVVRAPTSKQASDITSSAKASNKQGAQSSKDSADSEDDQADESHDAGKNPEGFERNLSIETKILIRSEMLL